MEETMKVISPEGLPLGATGRVSRQLDNLEGKTIGEVYNNHFKGELMFQTYRRLLKKNIRASKSFRTTSFPSSMWVVTRRRRKRIAKEIAAIAKEKGCHAIITGNGG